MFVAIKFDAYVDVYETYVFSTLGCFLLVVTSLVADRPRQALAIMVLSLLGIEALYWLDAFPKDKGVVTMLAIQNLSVSSLMVAISGFGSAYLVRMTKGLVEEVTRRADAASDSYAKLNSAMNSAQATSQAVGERLSASVARSTTSLESLKARVLEISKGMDRLTEALERSDSANAGRGVEPGLGEGGPLLLFGGGGAGLLGHRGDGRRRGEYRLPGLAEEGRGARSR